VRGKNHEQFQVRRLNMEWITRNRIKVLCAIHFSWHPARDGRTMMQTQRLINPPAADFLDLNGF
jgi:hypothetical protein